MLKLTLISGEGVRSQSRGSDVRPSARPRTLGQQTSESRSSTYTDIGHRCKSKLSSKYYQNVTEKKPEVKYHLVNQSTPFYTHTHKKLLIQVQIIKNGNLWGKGSWYSYVVRDMHACYTLKVHVAMSS